MESLFGNTRAKITNDTEENICLLCDNGDDSPYHQLFACINVSDKTSHALKEELRAIQPEICLNCNNYVMEILVPVNSLTIQHLFIDRVKYLKDQHDLIDEMHGID